MSKRLDFEAALASVLETVKHVDRADIGVHGVAVKGYWVGKNTLRIDIQGKEAEIRALLEN